MTRLKIGLVGVGGIAQYHLPRLRERLDDIELAAAADVNPAAEAAARSAGFARFSTDFRQILPHIDALLICIPTHLHAQVAMLALDAGKAVFCEKPLARTLEQAESIATVARLTRSPLQVGFVRRFDPEWLKVRELIQDGKIGRPVIWRDNYAAHGPTGGWFNRIDEGGGPLLDGLIHNYDFALFTFGAVKSIAAQGATLRAGSTAPDNVAAHVRFASGDEMWANWCWSLPSGVIGTRVFEIIGPSGTISFPKPPADATKKQIVVTTGPDKTETHTVPTDSLLRAFSAQMDEFIAVARREKLPRAGVAEGIASLRIALDLLACI